VCSSAVIEVMSGPPAEKSVREAGGCPHRHEADGAFQDERLGRTKSS
jgi:hypothetical protein